MKRLDAGPDACLPTCAKNRVTTEGKHYEGVIWFIGRGRGGIFVTFYGVESPVFRVRRGRLVRSLLAAEGNHRVTVYIG